MRFATRSSNTEYRLAELLGALSFASDLGIGLPMEWGARCCYISMEIGHEIALSTTDLADLYYAELLKMAGCTCSVHEFSALIAPPESGPPRSSAKVDPSSPLAFLSWMMGHMAIGAPLPTRQVLSFLLRGGDVIREGTRGQCEVGRRVAQRLGLSVEVEQALLNFCEQWDGKGMPDGLKGNEIPLLSRMLSLSATLGFVYWLGGSQSVKDVAEARRGTVFDPDLVDAFLSLADRQGFWEGLEVETVWETVLAMEPAAPTMANEEMLHEVALVLADYADMKTPASLGHSRSVARLSLDVARSMALPPKEVSDIELAALIHDLGLAAVPSLSLTKPQSRLSDSDWEYVRLHPYYAERILSRVPGFASVSDLVSSHHERMDGQGYYRGVSGPQLPVGARVLALADAFHELTEEKPERPRLEIEEALAALQPRIGSQFDPDCFTALSDVLGTAPPRIQQRRPLPAGLSEREVGVLRFAARGLTRLQIAEKLFLSESTVRHHLESIYSKIGVNSRAAAVLFAVENDLLN
jgi:HD-GYP domain-containing protein (c-di-GMP phosphodiesterase class II)